MRSHPFTLTARVAAVALIGIAGILSIVASDNGSGGMTSSGGSGTTASIFPRYAFVANTSDNSVSTYVVDASTGRLKWIGKVDAGTGPVSVTVDPSGKYAYVANFTDGSVSQYSIGTNGALAVIGAPVPSGSGPQSVTVDPSGKFAYVANFGSNSVSQYTIGTDGSLTPNGTAAAGGFPTSVTVDPTGKFAYVANNGDDNVSQYNIGTNGALIPMSTATVSSGVSPASVAVDPSGKYAFVTNESDGTVSQYTISATGALTPNGAPAMAGTSPEFVAVDPSGKYVYVANYGSGNVSQYSISATGALTPLSTATVSAGTNPTSVTVDPSGKYVYVTNTGSTNVSQYTIGANGILSPLSPATIAERSTVFSMAVVGSSAAVQAVPKFAYVANSNDASVSAYSIAATSGVLTKISCTSGAPACTGLDFAAGSATSAPSSVTIDPSGKFAYLANGAGSGSVSAYSIDAASGVLAKISCVGGAPAGCSGSDFAAGSGTSTPSSVTVDPSGKYAYVANSADSSVSAYSINASTGVLTHISCSTGCSGSDFAAGSATSAPSSVTVDPSGKFAYVANSNDASVSAYSINAASGVLTKINCVGGALAGCSGTDFQAGTSPSSVTIDPSGRFAYVANSISASVTAYSINATSGVLTKIGCSAGGCSGTDFQAGTSPSSVTTAGTWQ